MVEPENEGLSIRAQCQLLSLSRSSLYYRPQSESEENLQLMKMIDQQYLNTPFYGSRKLTEWLCKQGWEVNRKRVQRLMQLMGIKAIYQKPKYRAGTEHKIYPYLLKGLEVNRSNQVWASDITYVPMKKGFLYLVAIIDWHSRFVLSWNLSNTMDVHFCMEALEHALTLGKPTIFNSDQGSQYTSQLFTNRLLSEGIHISMDGKGRCFDNIFMERLWRSVKYEDLYLKDYETVPAVYWGLSAYFQFFNHERLHQALDYLTPAQVYDASR